MGDEMSRNLASATSEEDELWRTCNHNCTWRPCRHKHWHWVCADLQECQAEVEEKNSQKAYEKIMADAREKRAQGAK